MFKKIILMSTILVSLGSFVCGYGNGKSPAVTSPPPSNTKRYVPLLNTSINFIGLGGLEMGRDWGVGSKEVRTHPNNDIAQATLTTAVHAGINLIDTANAYHLSQQRIGEYLAKSGNRTELIIESKVGNYSIVATDKRCKLPSSNGIYCNSPAADYDFSATAVTQDVETSLAQLQTPYLDIVYLHMGDNPKEVLEDQQAVAALKQLQKQGKVRHIGISVDNPQVAIEAIRSGDFDAIQLEYNLLNQTNAEAIALAHQKGMAVIVRGGLGTGLLTPHVAPFLNDPDLPYREQIQALLQLTHNNYQELIALELAFLYSNPNITSVIIGAGSPQHLKEDMALLDQFNDPQLLAQAEKLMSQYQPEGFTDSVDAYFAKICKSGATERLSHET